MSKNAVGEKVAMFVKLSTKLVMISLISLIAACAPLPKETATQPHPPKEVIAEEALPQTVVPKDKTPERVIPEAVIAEEALPKEPITPNIIASDNITQPDPKPEPVPEPEPEPEPIDPLDPHHLIGLTDTAIIARIGEADFDFTETGIKIAHYRHEACQILLFFPEQASASGQKPTLTHVDIRPLILEQTVSLTACFDALGMRAEFHKTR